MVALAYIKHKKLESSRGTNLPILFNVANDGMMQTQSSPTSTNHLKINNKNDCAFG